MMPMFANQGVPRMTSMSLPISTSRVSMWNVSVSMCKGTLKEALEQVILVPLPTSTIVWIQHSIILMSLEKLMSMTLWEAPLSMSMRTP